MLKSYIQCNNWFVFFDYKKEQKRFKKKKKNQISHSSNVIWVGVSILNGSSLNLVDKSTYLRSSVSSTKIDTNMPLARAWTAIDRLLIIWKSDLTDKIKRSFFQAAVMSILLYGGTTWTLTKCMEKKLDSNYTRMLQVILNMSWRQHPTKQQLYGHLPPITKTIKINELDTAGEVGTST